MAASSIDALNATRQEAQGLFESKEYRKSGELFEQIYDGEDSTIAACLGFIHGRSNTSEYDPAKALTYYEVAARQGDVLSQRAMASLLINLGRVDEATDWCTKASESGDA